MITIDAKNAILGRISTYAAKQVLLGNDINVINCEECVVSGKNSFVLNAYIRKSHRRAPAKGPYFYRRPDMFVKRTIRGMLPFKRARGREAFKKIKCYIGVPESLKDQKIMAFENTSAEKLHATDFIKVKDLCKSIGGK